MEKLDVTIVGGGMITNDLLLPAIYHLQRTGIVRNIQICALNSAPLKYLRDNPELQQAFPGQSFTAYPDFLEPEQNNYPELYKEVISKMKPRQVVVVAMPDNLHYQVIIEALRNNQHVLCVKPLVLQYKQAAEIESIVKEKGLFVGVEYHKRFDRRSLVARRAYRLGQFGEFVMGDAKLIEPYYYRHSNFQNWFTVDRTDPFVYIGCHYVDLVYFITNLKPVEVSVEGVKGKFPNGNIGYMWSDARVRFENGAILSVTNGLGYPDAGAGSNDQGLLMYCEGKDKTGMIKHDDQYRGVAYCYLDNIGPGGSAYNYVSPDFFRFVPWEGEGYKPVGYGPDSVSAIIGAIKQIEDIAGDDLKKRRKMIEEIDNKGIIATPANSFINELVVEAGRMSILNDGRPVKILYKPEPHVEFR
ncbi:MAG TPA: Gfo/Idh/MocA family oxidoreductase [bacterium]|nr:Gfo/Idh/MocA family oxidoreductase [bacterium]HOL35808.1 Gfo/Idh/MocA family oxidoreductase [bacterium]